MAASTRVLAAARSILAEQRSVCSAFVKSPELRKLFSHSSSTARGSIGAHFRHSVDHFKAWHVAAMGVEAGDSIPRVFYERRDRDVTMEKDPGVAVRELEELVNGIDAMWPSFGSIRGLPMFPLFRVPGASGSVEGGEEGDVEFRSTVERELWFVSHHALHHNAMVYTIAAECSAEARDALPKTFGMAPATVDFMRSEAGYGIDGRCHQLVLDPLSYFIR